MVTIAIIAILASTILFAMVAAQTAAKVGRTKALIATLDGLLMERWETYATRRVPVLPNATHQDRLNALRELMRMEMPERFTDITAPPAFLRNAAGALWTPSLTEAYKRRLPASPNASANKGAKCLYLIVTLATGDGEARELFSADDIRVDPTDGMSMFVDAWGNPISFLRWPAGYLNSATYFVTEKQTGNALDDHDPFDPLKLDAAAYRLHPLVYSGGPDGVKDVAYDNESGALHQTGVNPYANLSSGMRVGTPMGEGTIDNITNHMMGVR